MGFLAWLFPALGRVDSSAGAPQSRSEWGPEKDNWEADHPAEHQGEKRIEIDARIRYRDGRGEESVRSIRTKLIYAYQDNDLGIYAVCNLRGAPRTFLASRVLEFTDLSTGEIVHGVKEHLWGAYWASPLGSADRVAEEARSEIDLLIYILRGEGYLSPKKRAIITTYLKRSFPSELLDDRDIAAVLPSGLPTRREFGASIKRCAALSADRRSILSAILNDFSRHTKDPITLATIAAARKGLQS
jgi:hypothetical protein